MTDLAADDRGTADHDSPRPAADLPWLLKLNANWRRVRWFGFFGAACIVAGGLVAAASAPAHSEVWTWAAAYLVLVGGAAQIVLGVAQALLTPQRPSAVVIDLQVLSFNAGNAAVVVGTAARVHLMGDAGAILVLVALVLSAYEVRGVRSRAAGMYRALVAVLAFSAAVGAVLTRLHPLR